MAFPAGYTKYDEYVIQSSKVAGSGSHTDFPVYVDLSDLSATFWSNVKSDGGDIRVTLDDGTTQLAIEVVAIDTGAETGEIHFKSTSLSTSVNTTVRIWYNGTDTLPAVTATYGRNNVWTDYKLVCHLEADPSGTAPQFTDSTGNGNDMTARGSNWASGDSVAGALPGGNGLVFDDADSQYLDADITFSADTDYTFSVWAQTDDTSIASNAFGSGRVLLTNRYMKLSLDRGLGSDAVVATGTTILSNDGPTSANTWRKLTLSSNATGSGNNYTTKGYVNGVEESGGGVAHATSGWPNTFDKFNVGVLLTSGSYTQHLSGKADEAKIRNGVVSDDWETTEYNNQSDHATWAVVTAKTAGGGSSAILPFIMHYAL